MSEPFSAPKVLSNQEDVDKDLFGDPVFAFLDILGFSQLVKYNAHSTVVDLYKIVINDTIQQFNQLKKMENEVRQEQYQEYYEPTGLRVINVSDSILLWIDNSKMMSVLDLLRGVKLFMRLALKFGLPLRGAVTKGPIGIFENDGVISMVGRPIVRAAELEKHQQWSGCVIDKMIVEYYKQYHKVVELSDKIPIIERDNKLLVYYDKIPIGDTLESGYVINWVHNSNFSEETIVKSFEDHDKRKYEDEKTKAKTDVKLRNTTDFFNYCNSLDYSK